MRDRFVVPRFGRSDEGRVVDSGLVCYVLRCAASRERQLIGSQSEGVKGDKVPVRARLLPKATKQHDVEKLERENEEEKRTLNLALSCLVNSCSLKPAFLAACWILSPCSSVPVAILTVLSGWRRAA